MFTISDATHSLASDPTPDPPGWETLPPELQRQVSELLGMPDLASLRLVSRASREVVASRFADLARDEARCADWIHAVETGPWREPPRVAFRVDPAPFAKWFPNLALACNLRRMRAALEAGASLPMTRDTCAIPDLHPHGITGGMYTAAGPLFVGRVQDAARGDCVVLIDRNGERRVPDALRHATLAFCEGADGGTPHGAAPSMRRGVVAVQFPDRPLVLYDADNGRVEHLPEAFAKSAFDGRAFVAFSPNGRYVAAHFDDKLVIHDSTNGQVVVERATSVGGGGFSVDSDGNVFVAYRLAEHGIVAPGGGHCIGAGHDALAYCYNLERRTWEPLRDAQGIHTGWLTLSSDGRYIVKRHRDTVVVLDRQVPDAAEITLRARIATPGPVSVAMSRGGMAIAVADRHGTVSLFDPTATAHASAIEPRLTLELPETAKGRRPELFFAPDGSHLDVVYPTEKGAEFLRATWA